MSCIRRDRKSPRHEITVPLELVIGLFGVQRVEVFVLSASLLPRLLFLEDSRRQTGGGRVLDSAGYFRGGRPGVRCP